MVALRAVESFGQEGISHQGHIQFALKVFVSGSLTVAFRLHKCAAEGLLDAAGLCHAANQGWFIVVAQFALEDQLPCCPDLSEMVELQAEIDRSHAEFPAALFTCLGRLGADTVDLLKLLHQMGRYGVGDVCVDQVEASKKR